MADYTVPFAPTSYQRPEQYRNPYVGNLLDLMQRQAEAQRQFDQQRMQLAGQRWQALGNAGAGIAQAIAEAPERKRQQQLAEMQFKTAERQAQIESAWENAPRTTDSSERMRYLANLPPGVARAIEANYRSVDVGDMQFAGLQRDEQQRRANELTGLAQRATVTAPLMSGGRPMPGQPAPEMLPVGPGFIASLPLETQTGAQQTADTLMEGQRARTRARQEDAALARRTARVGGAVETYRDVFGQFAPPELADARMPVTASGDLDMPRAQAIVTAAIERADPDLTKSGLDVQAAYWMNEQRAAEAAGDAPRAARAKQRLDDLRRVADTMSAARQNPPIQVNVGSTGLTQAQLAEVTRVRSAFDSNPIVKNFNDMAASWGTMERTLDRVGGPADLAMVYQFMKALDPTSVVRESEYASAAASGNLFAGWAARFNGYLKPEGGFLPPQVKQEFLELVRARVGVQRAQYENYRNEMGRLLDPVVGGNGAQHLPNYAQFIASIQPSVRYDSNGNRIR
ncbi:MAG: hypothetical protein VW405_03135 [Rhodospirillaceae bacterium]